MNSYPSEPEFDADGNVLSAEDWLGNRFAIGDPVMYCISAGRGQMMAIGHVRALRIQESSKKERVPNPNPPADQWDRFITVEVPSRRWVVEVQVHTVRTSGRWSNSRRTRPAWVNEMNITAINGIESIVL